MSSYFLFVFVTLSVMSIALTFSQSETVRERRGIPRSSRGFQIQNGKLSTARGFGKRGSFGRENGFFRLTAAEGSERNIGSFPLIEPFLVRGNIFETKSISGPYVQIGDFKKPPITWLSHLKPNKNYHLLGSTSLSDFFSGISDGNIPLRGTRF